jgi:hypothetical protein
VLESVVSKDSQPVPIIRRAERDDAIGELASKIRATYADATELRREAQKKGVEIGRMIVDACRNPEVIRLHAAAVAKEKAKNNGGGTPQRIYNWIAEELATLKGYNADYLEQVCRRYLRGLNKKLKNENKPETKYLEGGGIEIPVSGPLPVVKIEPPLSKPIDHPRIEEDLFEDAEEAPAASKPSAPPQPLTPQERAAKIADQLTEEAGEDKLNPAFWRVLVEKLTPTLKQNGFVVKRKRRRHA